MDFIHIIIYWNRNNSFGYDVILIYALSGPSFYYFITCCPLVKIDEIKRPSTCANE